jgi:hypothetical protein
VRQFNPNLRVNQIPAYFATHYSQRSPHFGQTLSLFPPVLIYKITPSALPDTFNTGSSNVNGLANNVGERHCAVTVLLQPKYPGNGVFA